MSAKRFHIIGRPKPVEHVEPDVPTFETGDIVKHVKTGHYYRLNVHHGDLLGRRIKLMDKDSAERWNWRFDHHKVGRFKLAAANLRRVQKA